MNTVHRFHYLKILLLLMMLSATGADWHTSQVLAAGTDRVVYRDALATGWQDWSWQSARNFNNTSPVYTGTRSIAFTVLEPFGALSLRAPVAINTSIYSAIVFSVYDKSSGGMYQVYTQPTDSGAASPVYTFSTRPVQAGTGEWRLIVVPLSVLGNPAQIQRITIQENAGKTGTTYVDEIKLVAKTSATVPDITRDGTRALGGPSGVAVAPNGRVYVAVYPQSRVMSWRTMTSMVSAAAPDRIFGLNASGLTNGDPDANGCTRGASAQLMCGPESVAVDSGGNLYVADTYHHRVLIFFNPDTDATPTTADRVLGQRDFDDTVVNADTVANNSKREGFNLPRGVAVDFADNLYVVDEFNQRVLKYTWPLWGVGGSSEMTIPDAVLGQPNLNTLGTGTPDSGATATNRFRLPLGVAIDGRGNIYVVDIWNNRVQRFDYPLTNGEAAAKVYTGFFNPHDVAIDPAGTLFVADTKNGKVKAFVNPLVDATADREYTGLQFPMGLAFDAAGNLLVADCGRAADGNVNSFPPCRRNPRGVILFKAPVASTAGPALSVDAAANRRAISPDIYGINWSSEQVAADLRVSVNRWGGNHITRYNWKTDTTNRAVDWYFQNIPNPNANPAALPNGSTSDTFVEQNRRTGTKTLLTIPMIGWTAKARANACGFSVAKYGPQQKTAPNNADCGNGIRPDGGEVTGNTPGDTSLRVGTAWAQEWMRHLIGKYGTAANGGVQLYNFDNEPFLWDWAHRDVHPVPAGYDEVRNKTWAYGAAIKAVDPTAKTLGPAEWGWDGYFYSAKDWAAGGNWKANPVDRKAHGNLPFAAWYLQQMRAYEQQNGRRILDYFDLHYYPQAPGVTLGAAGNATTQALRLESTRSLWDTTYLDKSWINDKVMLIPRMRAWINQNYPGTKLAIGEYNWGAFEHINGALAQADVLGIFGREGVDLATLWEGPGANQPVAYAFRMYRNYDGAGRGFGETSVRSQSGDQSKLAIYGSVRTSDGALTLIVVNKTAQSQTSRVSLANFAAGGPAAVYRYSEANLGAIVRQPNQAVTTTGFTAAFPPSSITLVVVPRAQ